MGKSDANECNESSLSNCRVQLALSTKKDGMILEKRLDDFRNQNHIIPPSHSLPSFSAYPHPVPYPQPHSKQAAVAGPRSAAEPARSGF